MGTGLLNGGVQRASPRSSFSPSSVPLSNTDSTSTGTDAARDPRQLVVSNLPFRVRWQDLKDLFRKAGVVLRTDVALTPDGRSRGFGVVLFAKAEDAHKAIELYNGWTWQNRVLSVQLDLVDPTGALAIAASQRSASLQQQSQNYQLALWHHQQQMPPASWASLGQALLPYPPPPPPFPLLPVTQSLAGSNQPSPAASPNLASQTIRPPLEPSRLRSSPQLQPQTTSVVPPSSTLLAPPPPPPPPPPFYLDGLVPMYPGVGSDTHTQFSGSEPRQPAPNGSYEWYPNQQPPPSMFNLQAGPPPSMYGNGGYQPFASMHGYSQLPGNQGLAPYCQTRPTSNLGPQTYPNRHIFVGNLPFNCQWQELKDLMRQAGSVIRADIAQGPDGRSRGFGSVLFTAPADAERAVQLFNGYDYNGRPLKVHFDKFSPPLPGANSAASPYPPISYFPQPQYTEPGPSRDYYSRYAADFDDSSSSGPETQYSNAGNSEPREPEAVVNNNGPNMNDVGSPGGSGSESAGVHDPASSSSNGGDSAATPATPSPSKLLKNGAGGRPALKQIVLPPPYPFGGAFSPLTGRLPLMTPSMPAFNFGGYPTTPPVYPQFFSPGLGAFSPGIHSPHYGPSHFMNPAPGAPLHQQDLNSYPYQPHFQPGPSSPINGSSPALPDTPGYFSPNAYSPAPDGSATFNQHLPPSTIAEEQLSEVNITGSEEEEGLGATLEEEEAGQETELAWLVEEKLEIGETVNGSGNGVELLPSAETTTTELEVPVAVAPESVFTPNGSRRKSFMAGLEEANRAVALALAGEESLLGGPIASTLRRASFEELKRTKS